MKNLLMTVLLFLIFFLLQNKIHAQANYRLNLLPKDGNTTQLTQLLANKNTNCNNAQECKAHLKQILYQLHQEGYLAASIDDVQQDSTQVIAHIFVGQRYEWLQLTAGNVPSKMLSRIGFNEQLQKNKVFNWNNVRQLKEKILIEAENNGYPFADIRLQNIQVTEDGKIRAELFLQKNKQITIDSLVLRGNARINSRYMSNYLGIQIGDVYDESLINNIGTRIQELSFVTQLQNPKVVFINEKAKINLFLNRKKASKFDFLLGVIPQTTPDNRQRYQITGEGLLNLQNALGLGELIALEFKSYPQNARELKTRLLYPYLPFVPVGGDLKFELYLRDTLFREVNAYIGLQYLFKGNNYLKGFWENKSNSLISLDSTAIALAERIPANLDVRNSLYGLEYNFQQLDYRLNPRNGWEINLTAAAGTKRVKENIGILAIGEAIGQNFQAQYDSLNSNNFRYKLGYQLTKYWGIGKRSTLKTSLKGAYLSDKQASPNELFRIGGIQLLRGFDDQSILASWYNVLTLEFRYLISQNAYFFLFGEGAYLQNNSRATDSTTIMLLDTDDFPFGVGAGITFETKAGVFGISYALGQQKDNPIQFRNGKIHFGYVNYF